MEAHANVVNQVHGLKLIPRKINANLDQAEMLMVSYQKGRNLNAGHWGGSLR